MLEQTKPIFKEVFKVLEAGISEEEKAIVDRVLQKLRENANHEMEKLER